MTQHTAAVCGDCHRTMSKIVRGICNTCTSRRKRAGIDLPPLRRHTKAAQVPHVIEDAIWLAATGAGLNEAARRLDMTTEALDRLLLRHDHRDVIETLRAHDELPESYLRGAHHTAEFRIPRGPARGNWKVA